MSISSSIKSLFSGARRRPFFALGAVFAATACVAVLAAGASALAGGSHEPNLGGDVRVGHTGSTDHDANHHGDRDSDLEDRDGVHDGDDDGDDQDDVTTPVTPGSLPADSDRDDSDDDSDHESRDADHDTSDHDTDGD